MRLVQVCYVVKDLPEHTRKEEDEEYPSFGKCERAKVASLKHFLKQGSCVVRNGVSWCPPPLPVGPVRCSLPENNRSQEEEEKEEEV